MKRTTVKIPDELDARLRHEARRRRMTISALTREALETHLGVGGQPRRRTLMAKGAVRIGGDVASRVEEILAEEAEAIYAETRAGWDEPRS